MQKSITSKCTFTVYLRQMPYSFLDLQNPISFESSVLTSHLIWPGIKYKIRNENETDFKKWANILNLKFFPMYVFSVIVWQASGSCVRMSCHSLTEFCIFYIGMSEYVFLSQFDRIFVPMYVFSITVWQNSVFISQFDRVLVLMHVFSITVWHSSVFFIRLTEFWFHCMYCYHSLTEFWFLCMQFLT